MMLLLGAAFIRCGVIRFAFAIPTPELSGTSEGKVDNMRSKRCSSATHSKINTPTGISIATALVLCFSVTWADDHDLIKVSQDPYTDPSAQHATEVEPVMIANGDTIVTAFQVGRFFGAGAENIGWATSRDGGRSWHRGFLTGMTSLVGGQWPAISLPTIVFDKRHKTYLIAAMPFDANGNGRGILVSRSIDGLNWSVPITAAASDGENGHWLACDNGAKSPHYGNCYDAYLDYSSGTAAVNALVVSKDGGQTWSAPVSSPDQSAGLPTSIAIQPNGNFVILGRIGGPNGDQAYAIPSVDGGLSLEATADITTHQFDYPWLRADPDLSSVVDSRGTIYVVFPDCRFRANCSDPACRFEPTTSFCATNDLVLTTSRNGVDWSALKRVPIDSITSNVDHFITGLGLLNDGDDDSHIVPTGPGEMVADYISAVFVDGQPYGAFAIARSPDSKTGAFNEAIYATKLREEHE
jgi:hypothetical protein